MASQVLLYAGDTCHLIGIFLLLKMAKSGRAFCENFLLCRQHTTIVSLIQNLNTFLLPHWIPGLSLKSQELYLVVYCTRYINLFTTYKSSMYYTSMKVFYLLSTALIIYIIKKGDTWHTSYDPQNDQSRHWKYIMLPSFAVAFVSHYVGAEVLEKSGFDVFELTWTFSIFLEMVAMVPQLALFRSERFVRENHQGGSKYEILQPIFLFGAYKICYLINWISIAKAGHRFKHLYVVCICGAIQVLLYAPFFKL